MAIFISIVLMVALIVVYLGLWLELHRAKRNAKEQYVQGHADGWDECIHSLRKKAVESDGYTTILAINDFPSRDTKEK